MFTNRHTRGEKRKEKRSKKRDNNNKKTNPTRINESKETGTIKKELRLRIFFFIKIKQLEKCKNKICKKNKK